MTALYISYDGLTDPLGQSQVLPYVFGLAERGIRFHVLSCEKPDRFRSMGSAVAATLRRKGIGWSPVPYTKRPPVLSTLFDIARLWYAARRIMAQERVNLVHCRGYVPSLIGRRIAVRGGIPFVFDMRGFWPEEKVDAGAWRLTNPLYRRVFEFFKREEAACFAAARSTVVLTHAARRELVRRGSVAESSLSVIPCSVDFDHFVVQSPAARGAVRHKLGIGVNDLLVVYLGSLGTWYMLDEMLEFFGVLRQRTDRQARFLLVTPDSGEMVRAAAGSRGISLDALRVVSATREEVSLLAGSADFGLSFIRPTASKVASSPTKIGEYLAMGLPVVTGPGIGDVDEVLAELGAGALVRSFDHDGYAGAVDDVLKLLMADPRSIRDGAREHYDLRLAVDEYARIYSNVTSRGRCESAP